MYRVQKMLHRRMLSFNYLTGAIVADEVWFRFPRSRKKRILRKWHKDPRNWKDISKNLILEGEAHE